MGVVHRDCESKVRGGLRWREAGGGLWRRTKSSARSPGEVLAHMWDVHGRSRNKKDTLERAVETINDHHFIG